MSNRISQFFFYILCLYITLKVMTNNLVFLRLFLSLAKNAFINFLLYCLTIFVLIIFRNFFFQSCLFWFNYLVDFHLYYCFFSSILAFFFLSLFYFLSQLFKNSNSGFNYFLSTISFANPFFLVQLCQPIFFILKLFINFFFYLF